MSKNTFTPTNILLPKNAAMEKWAVIACDQFSSEHDYWERVEKLVGDAPSTLKMIIPEAYLEEINEDEAIGHISKTMADYLDGDVFNEIADSFILVERTQPDGRVRRGVVGALDLETYEFATDKAIVRASEGTVLDRLPPRISVRKKACLELPHIITFIDDRDNTVMTPLMANAARFPVLYDFDLMEGGGHIKGMQVCGTDALGVLTALEALGAKNEMLMVIGDGNHSLAAAKVYWDEIKKGLSAAEQETHPARRALVELNCVYDDAIDFEAIHRVMFDVEPQALLSALEQAMPAGDDYKIRWVIQDQSGEISVAAACIGDMLSALQEFLDAYAQNNDARIDYIHGDDSVVKLAEAERTLGLILPSMDKGEFFATVEARGVFPKKSFSVGHARDKRYYLECRKIRL
ncbi:MAG: DUF1015 domain-containing protein [Oscillospiraceae bacterium]|nr:DUF1015 domain-containing protein [Oscillospiraceae bacterium]